MIKVNSSNQAHSTSWLLQITYSRAWSKCKNSNAGKRFNTWFHNFKRLSVVIPACGLQKDHPKSWNGIKFVKRSDKKISDKQTSDILRLRVLRTNSLKWILKMVLKISKSVLKILFIHFPFVGQKIVLFLPDQQSEVDTKNGFKNFTKSFLNTFFIHF